MSKPFQPQCSIFSAFRIVLNSNGEAMSRVQRHCVFYSQRCHLRIGPKRGSPANPKKAEASEPVIEKPQEAARTLTTTYPSLDGTVLGSIVPSFRNYTTFASDVLRLYRSFWRLVYRLPVEDQESAIAKLRTRFRRASHVKGQKHILQILRNARAEYEHWRGLVDSLEIKRSRPIVAAKKPKAEATRRIPFAAVEKLVYDPKTRVFTVAQRRGDTECQRDTQRPESADSRVSAKVRDFYRKKYGSSIAQTETPGAPAAVRQKGLTELRVSGSPSEYAWEDLRVLTGNTIPYVRAIGSVGYLQSTEFLKPKREMLRRERHYGWNVLNQRYSKGFAGFSKM